MKNQIKTFFKTFKVLFKPYLKLKYEDMFVMLDYYRMKG